MSDEHIVGFDFGTTNSLVSMIQGGRAINFDDNQGGPFPSIVCYEGEESIYGRKAKALLDEAGLGVHGNIVYSPKSELGEESIPVAGVLRDTVDIVSDVVGFVTRETYASARRKRIELEKIDRAVVTIPVSMNGKRRARLRDAFLRAGIRIEQFVHEPLAAIYGFFRSKDDKTARPQDDMNKMLRQYNGELILVFDWGGGTLDLTLCRLEDGKLDQLANDGTADVGGDEFDRLLRKAIIQSVLQERGIENPEIREGAKTKLRYRCEQAKIELSSDEISPRDKVHVYVPGFFRGLPDEDLEYWLSRDDLVDITKLLLEKGFKRIDALLKKAGVSYVHVSLCLPTGGMTNMPEIQSRLGERFRSSVQDHAREDTLVAEGAAWIAHDGARLHLAKSIELLLARNSHTPLLKAGWVLPTGCESQEPRFFNLYCTDPSDGHAKFQLWTPCDLGRVDRDDPRRWLENLIVEVDSKMPHFFERLCLTVQVDVNLILRVDARSLFKNHSDEKEIHDIEFGLSFPGKLSVKGDSTGPATSLANATKGKVGKQNDLERKKCSVTFLSNVHEYGCKNWMLWIPGELLAKRIDNLRNGQHHVLNGKSPNGGDGKWLTDENWESHFNKQHVYPSSKIQWIQRKERAYHLPCSKCNLPLNHPLCRCAYSSKRA